MIIVGINAYHGDVSAVSLRDGEVVAAVEEERFRRVKHWAGFPREAIRTCLDIGGVESQEIDYFAVSRDPQAHILRKIVFALQRRPSPRFMLDRLKNSSRICDVTAAIAATLNLNRRWVQERIHWVEHHPAHLASTFFASPFEEATVCALDGFGDFVSTSWAIGRHHTLDVLERIYFPHSLGMIYLAITQYLGFYKYGDEYKVMGLAPYGEPEYVDALRRLLYLKPDGKFEPDLSYFCHHRGRLEMTWDEGEPTLGPIYSRKLEALLGPARCDPSAPLEPRHEAIASSLQVVFEDAALHILKFLYQKTRLRQLCLAGGCAMNSVMNGKIREQTPFDEVYIQPASADNGTSLGAALYVWHQLLGKPRRFVMDHAYWGPESSENELQDAINAKKQELDQQECQVQHIGDEHELCQWTAQRIAAGKVVGWFQGRMEWGARALGNRSILADARRADMRDIINTKIKFREKFRPFAPSILEEALDQYFVAAVPDPFMIQVYPVRPEKRTVIPAITHVDGSGRLQTVSRQTNPRYWKLIKAFELLTGVPVLLNTSFNENEPIVHKPHEAMDCFLRTQMDVLVLGQTVVEKMSLR